MNKKSRRDEFTATTKRNLAGYAGYRCSCPECQIFTIGPNSSSETPALIGEAAHITAAAPGGARFNPSLTKDERKGFPNGIWLCCTCARKIDVDPDAYPVELLEEWKRSAAEVAKQQFSNTLGVMQYVEFAAPLLRIDTDNRFRYFGSTVTYDAKILESDIKNEVKITRINLILEGDTEDLYFDALKTLAVKVYLQAHLTDLTYMQLLMILRDRKLKSLASYTPRNSSFQENSEIFRTHMNSLVWADDDEPDNSIFDAIAGTIDGKWNVFLFNLTQFFPDMD